MTNLGAEAQIPYLSGGQIENEAAILLDSYWNGEFPIDVDALCDELGVGIIYIPGIKNTVGLDAYITSDFSRIVVDEKCVSENEARYRFSIAHELGHMVLHRDYYPSNIDNLDSYLQNLSEYRNSIAERQADEFAGLLLVPSSELVLKMQEAFGSDLIMGLGEQSSDERGDVYLKLLNHFGVSNMVLARRIQAVFPDITGIL